MFRGRIPTSYVAVSALLWLGAAAQATLPADTAVVFKLRAVPTNPQSAVVWTIRLDLKAQQVRENYVGWLIDLLTISHFDANGQVDAKWQKQQPDVPSIDGLWWVRHADPLAPTLPEFAMVPGLSGTAPVVSGASADMDYRFNGVPYVPPPEGPLYDGNVAALDFTFIIYPGPEPIDEGDDEPAEVGDPGGME
jgi:hypothetical protein